MNGRQFLESLAAHGLLSAAEVAEFSGGISPELLDTDAETLARELVRQQKLTKYQAANAYRGRAKALVFGEYVVLDKIGAGGMGQVFRARHRRMKRIVALKILPPNATRSEASVRRFYQEVEMAARLTHPNIVTAYDAGEAHGLHYLAMEFVDGHDLASYLKKHGPLSVEQAMNCVLQAAQGLQYAHSLGIVHRDIKPSNLLVDRKATIKILDMGLARHESSADEKAAAEGLTAAGEVLGTLDFMAPEQAHDSRNADARADIYSLGCTLYRLLTDKPPYAGDTPVKKLLAHREQPIPSLRQDRPEVPYRLDVLFQQMLAKDPRKRPQSMAEVIATLKALLSGTSEEQSSISVLQEAVSSEEWGSFLKHAAEQSGPIARGPGSSLNLAGPPDSPISDLTPTVRGEGSTSTRRQRRKPQPAIKVSKPVLMGAGGTAALVVAGLLVWAMAGSRSEPKRSKPADHAAAVATQPVAAPSAEARPAFKPPPPIPGVTQAAPVQPKASTTPAPKPPVASRPAQSTQVAKATTNAAKPAQPPPPPTKPAPKPASPLATTPPPTPQPLDKPIDLLKLIDLKRDVVEDRWTLEGGVLTRHADKQNGRLLVPFIPPSMYDLSMVFERRNSGHAAQIGIFLDGSQVALNAAEKECWLDPEPAHQTERRASLLTSAGTAMVLVCSVRGNRIYVTLNDTPALEWSGEPKTLSAGWASPNKAQMYLAMGGVAEEWRITKFEIAPPTRRVPAYERIDLLADYDPGRDKFNGAPEFNGGALLLPPTSDTSGTRVTLLRPRPNEYTVRAVVERIAGHGGLDFGLPFSRGRLSALVDRDSGADRRETGLYGWGAGTQMRSDMLALLPWRPYVISCTLAKDQLAMAVDGQVFSEASQVIFDYGRHAPEAEFGAPCAFTIFGASSSGFRIERLELTPRDWQPLPVPGGSALEAARNTSDAVVSQARALGSKPEQRVAGAEQLWREAAKAGDSAARYALLEAAGRLASEAGDLALVCKAAIELDRTFAGDHQPLYNACLPAVFKQARTVAAKQALAAEALRQIEVAQAVEDFDLALAVQSACTALKPLPQDLSKEFKARGVELAFWREQQQACEKAQAERGGKGTSASSQDVVGRYLALVLGNWTEAARYLQAGGDSALLAAVKLELIAPRTADDQAKAGEAWWVLADKANGPLKWVYVERAAAWYRRAAATAAGKTRTMLESRWRSISQQRKASGYAFAARHPFDATKIGDHWYKRYPTPMRWRMAQSICESVGGTLPILKTAADHQALVQLLTASNPSDQKFNCWLGATDEAEEGNFRWLDGTPLGPPFFVGWKPGEPNSTGGDEDFLMLEFYPEGNQLKTGWSDVKGDRSELLVCQWDF